MKLSQAGLRRAASDDNLWKANRCREPFDGRFYWRVCRKDVKAWRSQLSLCPRVHDDNVERETGFYKQERSLQTAPARMINICVKSIQSLLRSALLPESERLSMRVIKREVNLWFKECSEALAVGGSTGTVWFHRYAEFANIFFFSGEFKPVIDLAAESIKMKTKEDLFVWNPDELTALESALSDKITLSLDEYFSLYKDYAFIELCHKNMLAQLMKAIREIVQEGGKKEPVLESKKQSVLTVVQVTHQFDQLCKRVFDDLFSHFFKWRYARAKEKNTVESEFGACVKQLMCELNALQDNECIRTSCQTEIREVRLEIERLRAVIESEYFTLGEFEKLASLISDIHKVLVKGHPLFQAFIVSKERPYLTEVVKRLKLKTCHEDVLSNLIHYALFRRLDLALIDVPATYRPTYCETILRAEYAECFCPEIARRKMATTALESERQGKQSQRRFRSADVSLSKSQLPPQWKINLYEQKLKKTTGSSMLPAVQSAFTKLRDEYVIKEKQGEEELLTRQLEMLPEQNGRLVLPGADKDFGVAALQGRRIKGMEDTFHTSSVSFHAGDVEEKFISMIVCDGHGGPHAAVHFSRQFGDVLKGELSESCRYGWSLDAFYNALVLTSVKMTHCYTGDDGSTAAIFLYHREHLYACNIGDSTTLLITPATGTVTQLSAEELMAEKATARRVALYGGTLNADTAPGHEKVLGVRCAKGVPQLSMSSAFGDPYYGGALTARANVGRINVKSLQGNKHLVICYSDGVSEVDSVENIGAFICENYTKHGCLKKVTKDLAEQVFRSGSSDNITVLGWLLDLEQTGIAS